MVYGFYAEHFIFMDVVFINEMKSYHLVFNQPWAVRHPNA